MQWLFWFVYQNKKGLGLAFGAYFLQDFFFSMFFIEHIYNVTKRSVRLNGKFRQ